MAAYTPALTSFAILPDDGFAIGAEEYINNRVLVANTAQTFTIPTGAKRVSFNNTENIWVAYTFAGYDDKTAVVPSVNVTDGSGQVLNPKIRHLGKVSKISIISPVACLVSLAYFL